MCTYRHRLLLLLKPVGAREVCARGSRKPTRSTEHFPSRADIASDSNCNYKHFIINCYPYRRGFRNKRPALLRVTGQHLVSKRKHFTSGLIARANLLLTTASATLIKLVCIHVRIVTKGILLYGTTYTRHDSCTHSAGRFSEVYVTQYTEGKYSCTEIL